MKIELYLLLIFVALSNCKKYADRTKYTLEEEKDPEFWRQISREQRHRALNTKPNYKKAKNVILFIGDGMSTTTVTAGRILKGQLQGHTGEETDLAMDKLSYTGFSKTYCADSQVSDSAATATALVTGVKTNMGILGLTASQYRAVCEGSSDHELESFLVLGKKQGKSAGIVTTTMINHATPGAVYAHTSERRWYSDGRLSDEAKQHGCKDIAAQFIDKSAHFDVVLGGGLGHFLPNTSRDPVTNETYHRTDGRDLIEEWKQQRSAEKKSYRYVTDDAQLADVDVSKTDSILGIFNNDHMTYDYNRANDTNEPSLADMTKKAIEMLKKNPNGFTLLVEGGRIDHAHHGGFAQVALGELVAFDKAIGTAFDMTSSDDTLIVVTADHGHTLTMGSYSVRGNPIFGFAPIDSLKETAEDGKPYTTLLYANGPGYKMESNNTCAHDREDLTDVNIKGDPMYRQQAAVPLESETHGGEDVGVYSSGPYSHLLTGVFQQSYIGDIIMYAACIGEESSCNEKQETVAANVVYFFGVATSPTRAGSLLIFFCVSFILLVIATLACLYYVFRLKKQTNLEVRDLPTGGKSTQLSQLGPKSAEAAQKMI